MKMSKEDIEMQDKIYDIMCDNLTNIQVINILTDVYGMKILNNDVKKELEKMGYFI